MARRIDELTTEELELYLKDIMEDRSVLDMGFIETEAIHLILINLLKRKPLCLFSELEYKTLIEALVDTVVTYSSMFDDVLPKDWKRQLLNKLDYDASMIELYLFGVEIWKLLSDDDKEMVIRDIFAYLEDDLDDALIW